MNTKPRGDRGEDRAADHLVGRGYHIVKRNLRCASGEVDIIAYKADTLVFIEVKHWRTMPLEDLERSITAAKRRRILGCARQFLDAFPQWRRCGIRFDIVHVGSEQITHFEHAFTESGFP